MGLPLLLIMMDVILIILLPSLILSAFPNPNTVGYLLGYTVT